MALLLLLSASVTALLAAGSPAAAALPGSATPILPDRYCLSCICVAASVCDLNTECREVGGRTYCGPFYMTESFWRGSNITADPRFSGFDYLGCAKDADCAGKAVSRYMGLHATDCDGDGHITCKDFGLTHLLGPRGCHDPAQRRSAESTLFVRRFAGCLQDILGLLGAGRRVRPHCKPRLLTWVSAERLESQQRL